MSSGVLLPDFSNAFGCLVHDLLIAYGFDLKSLRLVITTLPPGIIELEYAHSSWSVIIHGVSHGFILGPIFQHIS